MFNPETGKELKSVGDFKEHWFTLWIESSLNGDAFIEVADSRWIYPLLKLERGVAKKIMEADSEELSLAVSRIKRIDYKTISIVQFEHTLFNRYRIENDCEVKWQGRQGEGTI